MRTRASLTTTVAAGAAGALHAVAHRVFPNQPRPPASVDDRWVDVSGARLRYRYTPGGGVPIVLIHGSNRSLEYWTEIIDLLPRGRCIVALDLVGASGSDRPDVAYDLPCHHTYLVGFLDALRIEQAVLVGHSFGGSLAAWTAAEAPERVAALALVATPGLPGSLVMRWPKSLFMRPGVLNRALGRLVRTRTSRRLCPDWLARQDLGMAGSLGAIEFTNALDRIHQPALIMMSPGDRRVPWEFAREYQARLPDATLVELPVEGGHDAIRAHGQLGAQVLRQFLDLVDLVTVETDLVGIEPVEARAMLPT